MIWTTDKTIWLIAAGCFFGSISIELVNEREPFGVEALPKQHQERRAENKFNKGAEALIFVKTVPEVPGTVIKIMNIKPRFYQGISVAVDKIDLKIIAPGSLPYRNTFGDIKPGKNVITVELFRGS